MSFGKNQLLPGESIIILEHQHFLALSRPLIATILALVILITVCSMASSIELLGLMIIPLGYLFWEIWKWRNREYIVTNRRVVKHEGVLTVHSFDSALDKINNVFYEQSLLGRMLNYGEVGLETASEQGTTLFPLIADPVGFKNSIVLQKENYKSNPSIAPPYRTPAEETLQLLDQLKQLLDRSAITLEEYEEKKKSLLGRL